MLPSRRLAELLRHSIFFTLSKLFVDFSMLAWLLHSSVKRVNILWPVTYFFLPHSFCMPYPYHYSLSVGHSTRNITFLKVQIMKLLVMQSSAPSRHSNPLQSKYSPLHPFLKHPQSMFLSYCQRPSSALIQNHKQN
jgi:hypothetical protein